MMGWLRSAFDAISEQGLSITWPFSWTGELVSRWKHFQESEVGGLNEDFVTKLDQTREIAGIPFIITSGFRSPEQNQSVIGAVPDSSHTKGLAVDIRVRTSREAALIVDAAKEVGITRRGIYVDSYWNPRHIHLDADPDKIDDVLFVKLEQN